ncbi:MAG: 30S ribosomal protein S2 [Candidatus Omnitrophica bacterium]|nr:30S ribosomal protein S2 [Candidatus Omnitrophota bacterium]
MSVITMKELLEAGVHFGHQVKRWNPKMKKYIFGERNGIYIIDLEKTEECLNRARDFILDLTTKGKTVLFVGTKKQAQNILKEEANRCGMYYVTERWLGGLLTNFSTIKKSIEQLKEIEKIKEDISFESLTKKERAQLDKKLEKLRKYLSGIVQMEKLPGIVFIVDIKKEETALKEAKRLSIPTIALIDTNADPDAVDYPIPGNDDAAKSIKLITTLIADAILEGRRRFLNYLSQETPLEFRKEEIVSSSELKVEEELKIKEIETELEEELKEEAKPKKLKPQSKTRRKE